MLGILVELGGLEHPDVRTADLVFEWHLGCPWVHDSISNCFMVSKSPFANGGAVISLSYGRP